MYFLGLGEQPLFPMAYNLDFPICRVPSLFVICYFGEIRVWWRVVRCACWYARGPTRFVCSK